MRLIGVDCDLTVCPSGEGWLSYLTTQMGGVEPKLPEILPYDLGTLYPDVQNPMEYWRTLDYNQFWPISGAVDKLKALSQYFGIVFLSAQKGVHAKHKYYWLKENFPFAQGVIMTKEKHLMNASVVAMIDDRMEMLQGFDPEKRVLYKTPYEQNVQCSVDSTIDSWDNFSVKEFCDNYL